MEISPSSILRAAEVPAKAQVNIQRKAQDQVEAVTQELLESVEAAPEPGKGQRLNVEA